MCYQLFHYGGRTVGRFVASLRAGGEEWRGKRDGGRLAVGAADIQPTDDFLGWHLRVQAGRRGDVSTHSLGTGAWKMCAISY